METIYNIIVSRNYYSSKHHIITDVIYRGTDIRVTILTKHAIFQGILGSIFFQRKVWKQKTKKPVAFRNSGFKIASQFHVVLPDS